MIGLKTRLASVAAIAVAATMGYATPASAQATRTWVSGVGDDVNPCSRTAPCKTFAGAISKTAIGGEINCLDPGGFGAVTITKSLTISCPYTEGGALAGGNGIVINDSTSPTPNTAVVYLRGLDVFGVSPPSNGIRFVTGAVLHIEDSTIKRFNAAGSAGVSIVPTTAGAKFFMNNVTVSENGSGATGGGIVVAPAAGGSVTGVITNTRVRNNANNALRLDSTNGSISVVVEFSDFSGSAQGISVQGTTNNARMMVTHSSIAHNSGFGIIANGLPAIMRVGDTTISGNGTGVFASGGASIVSFGTNRNFQNPVTGAGNDGAFTSVITEN